MGVIAGNGTPVTGLGGAAGYGELALARADEGSFAIDVSAVFQSGFLIGGTTYAASNLFVGIDGIVSFGSAIAGLPKNPATLTAPFIAPFLADIDTRLDGEGAESGPIWVDIDASTDVVTITWQDVGFYRRNASLTNTFQLQLYDQGGGNFDAVLRYGAINWVSGDLEGGWGGLGGTAAFVGYDLGTAAPPVSLPASGNEAALLALPQTPGNTGVAGLWVYAFGAGVPDPAGDGADTLAGSEGADTQLGLAGNDVLLGSAGADLLDGGAGIDTADYTSSATAVTADLALLAGTTGDAAGDVYVAVEALIGSAFDDRLAGDGSANQLAGGAGNDTLSGAGGADTLMGGAGDDLLTGGTGGDVLNGGAGWDIATYATSGTAVSVDLANAAANLGDAAGDSLTEIEAILGSAYDDRLAGDGAANWLDGGDGADVLAGRGRADTLRGGGGMDTASYADALTSVTADLAVPGTNAGEAAGDSYDSVEAVTGSAHADRLGGDGGANLLTGGAGSDVLLGRAAADMLLGGLGDDILIGGAAADRLEGGDGTDTAAYTDAAAAIFLDLTTPGLNSGDAAGDVFISIDAFAGSAFDDTLAGDGGANRLAGGGGADLLQGRAGADVLAGDAGADTLDGGTGADTLIGGEGVDYASYASGLALVLVDLATSSANKGDALGDTYSGIEGVIGTAFNDDLRGDGGDNLLNGGAGNDLLTARDGNDTIWGGFGADKLFGDGGADLLFGGDGADTITGGAGNDTLTGGAGADSLVGGDGLDVAGYSAELAALILDLVTPGLNKGAALGDRFLSIEGVAGGSGGDDLRGSAVANLLDGGAGHDRLTGRAGADTLTGGSGDDTLDGGTGADLLYGGDGTDWATYATATAAVRVDLLAPSLNSGAALGDSLISIEAVHGSALADNLAGDEAANRLDGGSGADFLAGRGGADTLFGGLGSDILYGGAGSDVLTGDTEADRLFGGGGADILSGGAGNDTLDGGAGADIFRGGLGIDWVSYSTAIGAIALDLAAPAANLGEAEGDVFAEIEAYAGSGFGDVMAGTLAANQMDGGAGADLLDGRAGNDTLRGGIGNDTLIGGAGADSLSGGDGFDYASYATAATGVKVHLTPGAAKTGDAVGDLFLSVEGIIGSAFADDLTGDAFANALDGGAGNDGLTGGAGADTLYGGAGDDTLEGGTGADFLDGGDGYDWVSYGRATAGQTIDLESPVRNSPTAAGDVFSRIEALRGSGFGDGLHGNFDANHFDGGAGNDTLSGRGGNDTLSGGNGNDVVYGGDGADFLAGNSGADRLFGEGGVDVLLGGDGNDTLDGGASDDLLTGGLGADQFRHDGLAWQGMDWVTDYVAGQGDALVFTTPGAVRAQFSVSFAVAEGAGGAAAEAYVTYLPTGQQIWAITDGAAMAELMLRLGTTSFDLL